VLNLGARWRWVVNIMHRRLYAGERPHYPANINLGGTQGWPEQIWRKSLAPSGF